MKPINSHNENRKLIRLLKYIVPFIVIALILLTSNNSGIAYASTVTTGTKVNVIVNYAEETATVTTGTGGSTKFFISLDKEKTWESLETKESDQTYRIVDISSMMSSKAIPIYFKGNKDTERCEVILLAEPGGVDAKYTIDNGEGRIIFTVTGTAIEYKKGTNGSWKTAVNYMPTLMYEVKGATLYYRTVATQYTRAGKIATVKIPKRPSAPSVKLDGGKFEITGMKSGVTQYRDVNSMEWKTFTLTDPKVKTVTIFGLLPIAANNSQIPASAIEFRTIGDTKKIASGVKLLEIPLQQVCPDTVAVTGTTLTINDTVKRNYEYTKVERTAALNMTTAKWTSIASGKSVIVTKISPGDRILVRLKSTNDPVTKQVILASTYKEFVIASISPK